MQIRRPRYPDHNIMVMVSARVLDRITVTVGVSAINAYIV